MLADHNLQMLTDRAARGATVMSRRPALITQADVARAIRAARQCGAEAVEIRPDGTMRVMLSTEPKASETAIEPKAKVVL
jgi:hypothetical protein